MPQKIIRRFIMRDLVLRKDFNTLMDSFFDDFWNEVSNLISSNHKILNV